MPKYYAVIHGLKPGIYKSWDECKKQVLGFPGAKYKSFPSQKQAEEWMGGGECGTPTKPKIEKYYAVKKGIILFGQENFNRFIKSVKK